MRIASQKYSCKGACVKRRSTDTGSYFSQRAELLNIIYSTAEEHKMYFVPGERIYIRLSLRRTLVLQIVIDQSERSKHSISAEFRFKDRHAIITVHNNKTPSFREGAKLLARLRIKLLLIC